MMEENDARNEKQLFPELKVWRKAVLSEAILLFVGFQ
jgi:hypothetical protein